MDDEGENTLKQKRAILYSTDSQHGAYYQKAGNLNAGMLTDTRLSSNVAMLNSNQVFTGANRFAGAVTSTNTANVLGGTFGGTFTGTAVIAGVLYIALRNSDLNGFRATISGGGHESPVRLGGRRNQGASRAKRGRRGVIA